MTMMPARPAVPQASPHISVVPTQRTKRAAQLMLADLAKANGYDVVTGHAHRVEPGQWPALMALLLNSGRLGRPRKFEEYTAAERRSAHARYATGDRSAGTVAAEREYQRLHKRQVRARGAA